LAETNSFEKTAARVDRTQPAISEQIRTLEDAVGVSLFHRKTRTVALTPEGKRLAERLKPILNDLDAVIEEFSKLSTLEIGEVRVGASPTLACYILPEVIGSFRNEHPGIRVLFTDEPAARLEKMVEARDLDFYFGPKPSRESSLRFRVVANDPYVVIAPRSHPLVRSGYRDVREISKYPVLLMSHGTNVREHVDRFFKKHHLHIDPVEEVANHFTLGGLVEAGCGITLLPRSAHPVISHPGTVAVSVPDPTFVRSLGVATRRDYKPAPAAQHFLSTMTPLVKAIIQHRDLVKLSRSSR
jgi:DNA-binding transcriptional LysR family regulator